MNKLELIKRNTEEIVTEAELKAILKKKKPVCYCGYEPSGALHIGHLSTLVKLIDMQKAGFKVIVLLADIHALVNRKGSPEFIAKQVNIWKKAIKKLDSYIMYNPYIYYKLKSNKRKKIGKKI